METPLLQLDDNFLFADMEALGIADLSVITGVDTNTFLDLDGSNQDSDANSLEDGNELTRCRKKVADRRRVYRERLKGERKELRHQQTTLSEDLVQLAKRKKEEKDQFDKSQPTSYFMWKSIALRQREERSLAEAKQRELTAAVKMQATYIETLRGVVRKRLRLGDSLIADERSVRKTMRVAESELIYAYIREIDANYRHIDEVLGSVALAATGTTVNTVNRREDDGEVKYYERIVKDVLPFSFDETGHYLWKVGNQIFDSKACYQSYDDVDDPDNTYTRTFQDKIILETGATAKIRRRHATRRYVEKNHTSFTWKNVSEGDGMFSGLQWDETGWASIRPSTDKAEPGTVLEMYMRRTPVNFKMTKPLVADDKQLHRSLQALGNREWDALVTSMEKLLLDDMFKDIIVKK
ncbi:hypothetical protein F441_13300 [Phytophthora nicotianae CJ01A1]|uniref:Uncharacterized protein n=1 Tax=Phytophthora nicotianae CJ01A1 TaxID=1317063 RepID=W2WLB5_PHYNI|nr:hypothetical protein F441_13300 [Phytophthora nicotianae CJ01A1]